MAEKVDIKEMDAAREAYIIQLLSDPRNVLHAEFKGTITTPDGHVVEFDHVRKSVPAFATYRDLKDEIDDRVDRLEVSFDKRLGIGRNERPARPKG